MLFTGLVASSAGELVGYLFGERGTWGGFEERALHRPRFVRPEDRPAAYAFPAD
jgi:hypothetical protein